MTVREAFEKERHLLLPLPDNPVVTDERVEVKVGKTPYIRFDLNDYSVPHTLVRRTLTVLASEKTVRILSDENEVVAEHERSYYKGQQVEDQAHISELQEQKRQARQHRGLDRLQHAAPSSKDLMVSLAERGANLGSATAALLRLLDHYGAQELESAIKEALISSAPHPSSVRHILERNAKAKGAPPPVPVVLPNDPRVRDMTIRHHDLESYDALTEVKNDDDDKQH
jgi:hypothetical protein